MAEAKLGVYISIYQWKDNLVSSSFNTHKVPGSKVFPCDSHPELWKEHAWMQVSPFRFMPASADRASKYERSLTVTEGDL